MKIFLQILGMVLFSTLACAQHTNVLVVSLYQRALYFYRP